MPEQPDSTTITFRLNPNARWHERDPLNGRSVTSADVQFSLQRQMEGDATFVRKAKWANIDSIQTPDPAGNTSTFQLAITRAGEALSVTLRSSAYRLRTTKLPATVTLTATVTGPDGGPLVGVAASFSLSIPGVPLVTGTVTTDATGIASFRVTVPAGAGVGTAAATVFVSAEGIGEASGRTAITIQ